MNAKNRRSINSALLETIGDELLAADPVDRLPERGLRVEYIAAELIRPDPVQPRRVLPEAVHQAFHSDRLTPTQALRELIQIAQLAARQQGRPFASVTDLLGDSNGEEEAEPPHLTPEEQLLRDLVNLAFTIRDDGQVNPLTVIDVTQGVTRLYRIETGERRYWATWLLRDFLTGYEGDGTIPCIVIPSGRASIFRQAKENTARAGLSAIAMARQAALLILAVHGVEKPEGAAGNDFYRQALELDLRDKRAYTSDILAAMGGISRSHLSHYKALLKLSDEAIELADRHHLDEGVLRHVLLLDSRDHGEMIRQIIALGLTRKQVKEICEHGTDQENVEEASTTYSRPILQFARLLRFRTPVSVQELASAIVEQERDRHVARAKVQMLKDLVLHLEQILEED